jgi:hypothetical protein
MGVTPGQWVRHYARRHLGRIALWAGAVTATITHLFFIASNSHGLGWSLLGISGILLGVAWVILEMLENVTVGIVVEPLPLGRFERRLVKAMVMVAAVGVALWLLGTLALSETH